MGRHAGFIAADVGLAGGAEYIITPEFPIPIQDLAKKISSPKRKKQSLIIVVRKETIPLKTIAMMAQLLRQLTPGLEYRACILGHTQHGKGRPRPRAIALLPLTWEI